MANSAKQTKSESETTKGETMKTTAKLETVERAMAEINRKTYKGNVIFERCEPNSRSVLFTLRVKDSHAPGARRSQSGRRMPKACWHVHGDLFDAILAIEPNAKIVSRGGPGAVVDRNGGNWQDCNIGSQMDPMMFSEACDCNR